MVNRRKGGVCTIYEGERSVSNTFRRRVKRKSVRTSLREVTERLRDVMERTRLVMGTLYKAMIVRTKNVSRERAKETYRSDYMRTERWVYLDLARDFRIEDNI